MTTFTLGLRTDAGRHRDHNEDSIFAGPLPVAAAEPWHLLAVADGVGGHQLGEWASGQAITTLVEELARWDGTGDPRDALRSAFTAANAVVRTGNEAAAADGRSAAASTLVAALVQGERFWWANVGDSRAYRIGGGQIEQITRDHSWLAEAVASGRISEAEAAESEYRHVITRSIGGDRTVEVDVDGPLPLEAGEALLLCSDGLYEQVEAAELLETVSMLAPDWAAERLIELGNERGSPDNLSVVIGARPVTATTISTAERPQAATGAAAGAAGGGRRLPRPGPRGSRRRLALALVLALVLTACVVGATRLFNTLPAPPPEVVDPMSWISWFISSEEAQLWRLRLS